MHNDIKEAKLMVIVFILVCVVLKIIFYNENIMGIIKITASLFWLIIMPGFAIMYNWKDKLPFIERLFMSIALGTAVVGIPSYYLGILGLHIRYHGILIPAVIFILVSIVLYKKRNRHHDKESDKDSKAE